MLRPVHVFSRTHLSSLSVISGSVGDVAAVIGYPAEIDMSELRTTTSASLPGEINQQPHLESHPSFDEIYCTYQQIVRGICLRVLRDPIEAEDATQDVFLRVLLKLHTFRGRAALSSWLYRVTTNLVLMRFRRNKCKPMLLAGFMEDHVLPPMELGGSDACLEWAADRIDIETAIGRLPLGTRRIFVLHDIEGYRHREIADHFGCSIGNSKSQLHKARRRLRTLLGHQETMPAEETLD